MSFDQSDDRNSVCGPANQKQKKKDNNTGACRTSKSTANIAVDSEVDSEVDSFSEQNGVLDKYLNDYNFGNKTLNIKRYIYFRGYEKNSREQSIQSLPRNLPRNLAFCVRALVMIRPLYFRP